MVKHAQIIRRMLPTNCLSVFDHYVGLLLKGLKYVLSPSFVKKIKFCPIDIVKLSLLRYHAMILSKLKEMIKFYHEISMYFMIKLAHLV